MPPFTQSELRRSVHSICATNSLKLSLVIGSMVLCLLCSRVVDGQSNTSAQNSSTPQEGATSSLSQTPDKQTPVEVTVTTKTTFRFLISKPKDYGAKDKHPLLLFLHGAGERGTDIDRVTVHGPPMMIKQGRELPFIVVSPQCPSGQWWDAASLEGLLDHLESNYRVDKNRVYVTGLSMGGYGTWDLALRCSKRLAAIAPICGGGNYYIAERTGAISTPAWCFHGEKDNVIPAEESKRMIAALKKHNVEHRLTLYPETGHNSWMQAYSNPELFRWLLAHARDDRE